MKKSSFSLRSHRLVSDINVVPYIDVMLVLLVVFMVTTPLLTEGVYVDLPEASGESIQQAEQIDRMIVSVDKHASIYISVNGAQSTKVDMATLNNNVRKQLKLNPKTEFYVKGDKEVNYGAVVRLMSTLQGSGVPNVGLITQAVDVQ